MNDALAKHGCGCVFLIGVKRVVVPAQRRKRLHLLHAEPLPHLRRVSHAQPSHARRHPPQLLQQHLPFFLLLSLACFGGSVWPLSFLSNSERSAKPNQGKARRIVSCFVRCSLSSVHLLVPANFFFPALFLSLLVVEQQQHVNCGEVVDQGRALVRCPPTPSD